MYVVINMVAAFYAWCHAGLCGIAEVYEGKQAASGECRMSSANWPNAGTGTHSACTVWDDARRSDAPDMLSSLFEGLHFLRYGGCRVGVD